MEVIDMKTVKLPREVDARPFGSPAQLARFEQAMDAVKIDKLHEIATKMRELSFEDMYRMTHGMGNVELAFDLIQWARKYTGVSPLPTQTGRRCSGCGGDMIVQEVEGRGELEWCPICDAEDEDGDTGPSEGLEPSKSIPEGRQDEAPKALGSPIQQPR